MQLLTNCNPNTIEILGLKPEQYLYVSPVGQELLDNKKLFLSKRAVQSFGGYATAQLRRLDNKSARTISQADREQHILNSIKSASYVWPDMYRYACDDFKIKLYLDKKGPASLDDINNNDKDIFMDVNLKHYPLRDYRGLWSLMKAIVSDYDKLGQRNSKAIEHGKLGKHMMHLVRLYLMCLDILEKEEINTYREHDIPLLMEIRNGKYLDVNNHPIPEFYDMVNECEKKLQYAAKHTNLPDKPDYNKINELLMSINERIVLGKV